MCVLSNLIIHNILCCTEQQSTKSFTFGVNYEYELLYGVFSSCRKWEMLQNVYHLVHFYVSEKQEDHYFSLIYIIVRRFFMSMTKFPKAIDFTPPILLFVGFL